jgi:hypothetical protein
MPSTRWAFCIKPRTMDWRVMVGLVSLSPYSAPACVPMMPKGALARVSLRAAGCNTDKYKSSSGTVPCCLFRPAFWK